jgi:hypothetical protein
VAENDAIEWARIHRAAFETTPLVEMRGSERIQVGFTLDLYARFPVEKPTSAERRDESVRILDRLRSIVASLAPAEGSRARVEIEAARDAITLRPENELEPEVSLRARVFHGDDYFAAVTDDERTRMSDVDGKLTAMGLRRRHW